MPAYVVVDTKIHDDEAYERYKLLAKPLAEKHGGEYLVRGGALEVLEDELWRPTRLVIIRFPDVAAAKAFHADPEYAPVKAMRNGAAACTFSIVEGF
jgi:uncharacterized protein (DUF1330 family)